MKHAYLQLSVCGVALLAALGACGTSHPQNNSNTNWLRECSASKDCSSDEQCACGVCTVACTSDDACQSDRAPDAVCASVAELGCAGSGKGAVCTAGCERNADCGDGHLYCYAGSCIDVRTLSGRPERDAAVELDDDAQVGTNDGGSMQTRDGGSTGPTDPPPQGMSCEERLGCDADSACLNDHCQRLWSGEGCEPASELRGSCTTDADCKQGLLCHIDGTCIEPGKCDRFGMTTYASVGDIGALTVTKDSVFLLDRGTKDAVGNSNGDGAILRVALSDGSVQPVVTGIDEPRGMLVDSERVFWVHGSTSVGQADRADGANSVELTFDGNNFTWVQNATHLYAVAGEGNSMPKLFRIAKGTSDAEELGGDMPALFPDALGIDSEYVYMGSGSTLLRWSVADGSMLPATTGGLTDPNFIDRDSFYVGGADLDTNIASISKDDGQLTFLAKLGRIYGGIFWLRAFHDHVYFLHVPQTEPSPVPSTVMRAPIVPGETETVATLGVDSFFADISDLGLFWIQDHRLVRQVIEDYATGPSPAQGADGGPCFGDLACDDGLTCVDAVCTVVEPTCEERLGCSADEACLNERCQRLWSGEGCEPAADGRASCATDDDCDSGFVCHVDGTCIEPGKCDRFGLTTLATLGDVAAMTVSKDSVLVLDKSTDDALGNDQSTGAILNVSIADGSVQTVIDHLYRPLDMKVDGSRVYWRHGTGGEIGFGWADRTDGGNPGDLPLGSDVLDVEWLLSADHVYVLIVKSTDRDWLYRFAKGTTTLEPLSDQGLHGAYGMGLDSDYVYFDYGRRWSLADSMVLEPTPTSAHVVDPSFIDHDRIFYTWDDETHRVGYTTKADNHQVALASLATDIPGPMYWLKVYRDDVYWLNARPLDDSSIPMESIVQRAPLSPGDVETVAYLADGSHFVDVSDRGLFSIQGHRLVRQVIEDYASGPSPAQGAAGAPCFGDATCDSGLSCVETLCE